MGISTTPKSPLLLFLFASASICCLSARADFSILGYNPDDAGELFRQWREKHGKVYRCVEEAERRFENFQKNLVYVRRASNHVVGLNKFADLSNEEYKDMYLSKIKRPETKRKTAKMGRRKEARCEAPASLDWRKRGIVTGVKDQGNCGSCWAFSSTGAMEGVNAIATGDLISLSEQELVSCDSANYGCQGGYMDYAFQWVIYNGGIDAESDYPYTGENATCNIKKEENKVVTIEGYQDVDEDDTALLCAVVNQPVSVGIDASAIDFQLYKEGIYHGHCSSNPDDVDHAVLIVGYGTEGEVDYWIVKNSWGKDWGMEGYINIRRNTDLGSGVCAINSMASYPTKQSTTLSPFPSPGAPPPPLTPPPPPPPPPPSPSPSQCGDFSYCSAGETCCCLLELGDFCLIHGCCEYQNAVCCTGTDYCCPSDYPICNVEEGLCLQNYGDVLGVAAKKRKLANHKFPWTKFGGASESEQPHLVWKREGFGALR